MTSHKVIPSAQTENPSQINGTENKLQSNQSFDQHIWSKLLNHQTPENNDYPSKSLHKPKEKQGHSFGEYGLIISVCDLESKFVSNPGSVAYDLRDLRKIS